MERDNTLPTLRDYGAVLFRRRYVVAATFALTVLVVAAYTWSRAPLYRATTTLIIDPDLPDATASSAAASLLLAREFYQTQYEIIRSNAVMKRTVEAGKLAADPVFAESKSPVDALRARVGVDPVPQSRLVRLTVDHEDRERAIALADILSQVYIEFAMDDRRTASKNAFDWLSKQIEMLRGKVEKSERGLLEYEGKEDLVSIERRRSLLEERLAKLSQSYNELSAKSVELETVLQQVQRLQRQPELAESLPKILENSLIQKLKEELSTLSVELARVSQKYKPKHPEVVSLESQIASVRSRLSNEVAKINRSLEIEFQINKAKENAVKESLDTLKGDSMRLAEQSIEYGVLEREAKSNRQIYDVLLQRLREADLGGNLAGQNVRVLDPATASTRPNSPRKMLNMMIGILLGLLGGIAIAFLVEHVDNSIRNEDDVSFHLHQPLLGMVPREKGGLRPGEEPSEPFQHAYANIKTKLRLHSRDHLLRTLLVTSAVRDEGKTVTSVSLAKSFAQSGASVLLIDADMFKAGVGKMLDVRQEVGLSDYFLRDADVKAIVRPTKIPNLHLIPAGLIPPNPAELLSSAKLKTLIESARDQYQIVIIDSPPVTAALDVAFLGAVADGILLAVRASSTPRPLVQKVLTQLEAAKGNLIGVVLTMATVPPEALGAYYYEYQKASN